MNEPGTPDRIRGAGLELGQGSGIPESPTESWCYFRSVCG